MAIDPDTKDWTWVLRERCGECGFEPTSVTREGLPARILAATGAVHAALHADDVRERPDASTWSSLEYGAHVRDVARIMRERLALILEHDDPAFANWDQDATAIDERYAEQSPARVAVELDVAAADLATAYAVVADDGWDRTGRRSNGSGFTAFTLGIYALHDLEHHAWDVADAAA